MTSILLRTGLVATAAAAGLALASPAWADTTININSGNVPTTAADYANHTCDANQGGGPYSGQDVWVFVLPGQHSTSGDFVSVSADFGIHGIAVITTAADPGDFDNGGPDAAKAWITTPSGWTLDDATASITGTASFFNLTHTCPASPDTSPSTIPPVPSPSMSIPVTPTAPGPSQSIGGCVCESASVSPSGTTGTSPSTGPAPSSSVGATATGTVPIGGVPTGGGDVPSHAGLIWGLSTLVVGLAGGIALLRLARRRLDAR